MGRSDHSRPWPAATPRRPLLSCALQELPAASVFPVPRDLRWGGGARVVGPVRAAHEPALPAQGYELHSGPDGPHLAFADEGGRRYGEQTVAQLTAGDGTLPEVHIRDWPDVAVRGFMLDISRDRVPTRATLERLVSLLAIARYNHLELYVEHTFASTGNEAVWRDASPLTGDDLQWLDDRCAAAGIELSVNQNCFGHFGRWLAHDAYRDRAECPDGIALEGGVRFPPTVLEPTGANADFAEDLVRQQLAHVRSRRVNIGCDETFELGRGRSAARAAEVGVVGVYLEHLQRIARPLLEDGCSLLVWGDVVGHHPERVAHLPAGDVTALVWGYEAPGAAVPDAPPRLAAVLRDLGIDLAGPTDFGTLIAPFVDAGVPFWVAPGTSSWNSLVGRLDNARANLLDAARVAGASGAGGYLVTDWGDNGHHQPPSVSDPPLLYGGAVSWCAATNANLDLSAVVSRYAADDPTGIVGSALETIGSIASRTGLVARNLSPIFAALFPRQAHLTSGHADPDRVAEVTAMLEQARDDLTRAEPGAADGATILAELDVAIGLARHGAVRLGASVGGPNPGPVAMRAELAELIGRYREAWLLRSRPGGLDDSVRHLERTLRTYDTA